MSTRGVKVRSGTTDVSLSCVIAGVGTRPTVTWSDGTNSISDGTDYTVNALEFDQNNERAESVLVVKKASTITTVYTCLLTSSEFSKTEEPHTVVLEVFSKYIFKLAQGIVPLIVSLTEDFALTGSIVRNIL